MSRTPEVCAYLGLGSNLGDRHANLRRAVALLSAQCQVEAVSSVYDTEPVGYSEQPRFLNAVCRMRTGLSPEALLALAKEVEAALGREATFRYGPRAIDVDILLYGELVMNAPDLVIPHPELARRAFVLVPLAELAPELVHPVLGKSISQLRLEVAGEEGVHEYKVPLEVGRRLP